MSNVSLEALDSSSQKVSSLADKGKFSKGITLIISTKFVCAIRTEWQYAPGIWDSEHVTGWKKIVDAVHEAGGKIYAQVGHIFISPSTSD